MADADPSPSRKSSGVSQKSEVISAGLVSHSPKESVSVPSHSPKTSVTAAPHSPKTSPKTSTAADHNAPKTSTAADHNAPKTSTAADHNAPKTSTAADHNAPKTSTAADHNAPKTSTAADHNAPKTSTAADHNAPKTSTAADHNSPKALVADSPTHETSPAAERLSPRASLSSAKSDVADVLKNTEADDISEVLKSLDDATATATAQDLASHHQALEPSKTSLTSAKGHADQEGLDVKLKYPKSVFFIITNEFCERFSFYGLRTLLAIYLTTILGYTDDSATVIYHTFVMLAYFFPILGAIVADSWLGKFRTIIYLSCVFAIGNITLTVASADQAIEGMPSKAISMVGLFLIALGTGGIKPCVAAFGGDQFIVPQQQPQLEKFFSIFYFTINAGSFCSTFITPILRSVPCLGVDSCYPLAFGVPAILMITSIIVFLAGQSFYIIKKPTGNIIVEIFKVIGNALNTKRKSKEKKKHWLDYAEAKFGKKSVHDIKMLLRVLFLYIPLPIFWALYDQQGSRWTFQATRMDGQIGGYTVKAEQMQVVNPLLILAFVPLFEVAVYPLLAKCNLLTKPLQRLTMGGILAGLAFVVSAFIELTLEPTYAVVPTAGNGQLRFYNGFNCNVTVVSELAAYDEDHRHVIAALGNWEIKDWAVDVSRPYQIEVTMDDPTCYTTPGPPAPVTQNVMLYEKEATSYFITYATGTEGLAVRDELSHDDVEKTSNANPKIRVIYNFIADNNLKNLNFVSKNGYSNIIPLNDTLVGTEYEELTISVYSLMYGTELVAENLNLEVGGVYSMIVQEESDATGTFYSSQLFTVTPPNSVHMMWLMPQYIIMTAGEVMYSVTGVQFSFTQAPVSMKSVIQAGWLLTVAVGNLIVVVIAESKLFERQIFEFLLFAALMFLDMIVFAAMAWNYKYVDLKEEEELLNQEMMLQRKNSTSEKTGIDNKMYTKEQD